jgi:hypothetical protein
MRRLKRVWSAQVTLESYNVNAVTEGIEALATTRVAIRPVGRMGNEGYVTTWQVIITALLTLPCPSLSSHTLP